MSTTRAATTAGLFRQRPQAPMAPMAPMQPLQTGGKDPRDAWYRPWGRYGRWGPTWGWPAYPYPAWGWGAWDPFWW
ncbi:unnamed protein product [Adineta ricciae]|uniref:Uncharacterized protein n=1 Tax=Adineta ricciae TaxID=249248 RepID=A0A815HM87_ADIRI|nr:unnamed protein product [Adineta ricciae]